MKSFKNTCKRLQRSFTSTSASWSSSKTFSRLFEVHERRFSTEPRLIPSTPRRYDNIHINLATIDPDDSRSIDQMVDDMKYSLEQWREGNIRGIWLYVPTSKADLIPSLIKNFEFDFHHGGPGFAVLSKWMDPTQECKFPPTPNTQLAVAGIVLNHRRELLVIQEKHNFYDKQNIKWKFPGGLCDLFEDLSAAATREVLEETGVKTQFNSILGMRHQHFARLGGSKTKISDLYVACHLSPLSSNESDVTINIDESEVKAAKWIHIEDFIEKTNETWPVNMEFATVLYQGLCDAGVTEAGELSGPVCGLVSKKVDSVSVPGTTYDLYLNDTF